MVDKRLMKVINPYHNRQDMSHKTDSWPSPLGVMTTGPPSMTTQMIEVKPYMTRRTLLGGNLAWLFFGFRTRVSGYTPFRHSVEPPSCIDMIGQFQMKMPAFGGKRGHLVVDFG